MLLGAFKRTAGGMHAFKLDPVNAGAGQSRDSREIQNQEQIASLQMSPGHTKMDGKVLS